MFPIVVEDVFQAHNGRWGMEQQQKYGGYDGDLSELVSSFAAFPVLLAS